MAVSMTRIRALERLRAVLYNHSYNPENIRTGAKILRQRLRGPALASYYPPRIVSPARDLNRMFPDLETIDEDEVDRVDSLMIRKSRGKGNPKKKRTAEESKKFGKRKPGQAAAKAAAAK